MKASKFTEALIAFVLKQAADGTPVGDVCRKAGIADALDVSFQEVVHSEHIEETGVTTQQYSRMAPNEHS